MLGRKITPTFAFLAECASCDSIAHSIFRTNRHFQGHSPGEFLSQLNFFCSVILLFSHVQYISCSFGAHATLLSDPFSLFNTTLLTISCLRKIKSYIETDSTICHIDYMIQYMVMGSRIKFRLMLKDGRSLNPSKSRSDFGTIRVFKFVENDERDGIFQETSGSSLSGPI